MGMVEPITRQEWNSFIVVFSSSHARCSIVNFPPIRSRLCACAKKQCSAQTRCVSGRSAWHCSCQRYDVIASVNTRTSTSAQLQSDLRLARVMFVFSLCSFCECVAVCRELHHGLCTLALYPAPSLPLLASSPHSSNRPITPPAASLFLQVSIYVAPFQFFSCFSTFIFCLLFRRLLLIRYHKIAMPSPPQCLNPQTAAKI